MMSKVIIGLEARETVFARTREVARRADAGETIPEADYHLNFANLQQLFGELTPERMQILQTLLDTGGQFPEELARRLGRNNDGIMRDVAVLQAHDLVAQDESGLIVAPWEAVELRLSMVAEHARAA
jgi:predicted transcriptional regulator